MFVFVNSPSPCCTHQGVFGGVCWLDRGNMEVW